MTTKKEIAQMIDAALLSPTTTPADVKKFCNYAKKNGIYAVDVETCHLPLAKKLLNGSGVKLVAVIGYPLGATSTEVKTFEAKKAVEYGADELDMVMNIGMFKAKEYDFVENDIKAVVSAAQGRLVKVIIETGYLTDDEIVKASKIVKKAGAHFVKTSSGWGPRGATTKDIKLIRKAVGEKFGVKAAGGIRNCDDAIALIKAGATRLGTSSPEKVLETCEE